MTCRLLPSLSHMHTLTCTHAHTHANTHFLGLPILSGLFGNTSGMTTERSPAGLASNIEHTNTHTHTYTHSLTHSLTHSNTHTHFYILSLFAHSISHTFALLGSPGFFQSSPPLHPQKLVVCSGLILCCCVFMAFVLLHFER